MKKFYVQDKVLTVPSLQETIFHINRIGQGSIKFRLDRVDVPGVILKWPIEEIHLGSYMKLKAGRINYSMGSVNGAIPLFDDEVAGRMIQYGACNIWAEIHFTLITEDSDG
ncbi:MAG: hypothetical protein NC489_08960 [Ruminococcus flavefaciens]|nr:hypothetical protein [Ruminococcus flavefaciens]